MLLIPEKDIVARNIQEQVAENVSDISELQDGADELKEDLNEFKTETNQSINSIASQAGSIARDVDGISELLTVDVLPRIDSLEQRPIGTRLYKHTLSGIVPDTANRYYMYPAGFISTDPTPLTISTFGQIIRPEVLKIWGYHINDSSKTDIVEFPVCHHAVIYQEEDPDTHIMRWACNIWQFYYGTYGYAKIFLDNMTDTVTQL